MRYIVIGGSGYLGSYIAKELVETRNAKVMVTYRSERPSWGWAESGQVEYTELDLDNEESVTSFCENISKIEDDVVVYYLASFHHPDKVEENPAYAWNINVTVLSKIVNSMPESGDLIYVSTDNVFSGKGFFYKFNETDACNPVNEYGRQKLVAERVVLGRGYNVVRCPFLIGKSLVDKPHFYDVILAEISKGRPFELFFDSYRSAISFKQAAKYLIELSEQFFRQGFGVAHVASDFPYSKYDVGLIMARSNGFDESLLKKIRFEMGGIFKAKREKNIILDNSKLKSMLNLGNIELEL